MKQPAIAGDADRRHRTPGTKRFAARLAALLAAVPALALAAAKESETFVWKDCPADVKVHAIREFMEIAQRDDLVVYSTKPGKLSGVCGRAKVPELKAKLAASSASARAAAARAAKSARARSPAPEGEERVFSFSLAELLDPDRELWLVRRLTAVGGRTADDLEDGADAVVHFGGTDKQGALVVGQKLRGVLVPNGVHTVTNDYRREVFGGDGWERRRAVERLRRYRWRADRPEAGAEPDGKPGAPAEEPAAPEFYFRTFGINYLNADHVFPLWLRARGGSFKTTVRTRKSCDRCGGKGRWSEWRGGAQQLVSCPACGGGGSVEVSKTYEFVPEGPGARRNTPFR